MGPIAADPIRGVVHVSPDLLHALGKVVHPIPLVLRSNTVALPQWSAFKWL